MATKKKPAPKKKATKKARPSRPYVLEVVVNDVEFKTTADSLRSALEAFIESSAFPLGAKTRAVFTYGEGRNLRTKTLYPARARRLMLLLRNKPQAAEIFAEAMAREVAA